MRSIYTLTLVLLFIYTPVFSQTLDFVYVDLKNCDSDCRESFKKSLMSITDSSDSIFVYFSNDLDPFVSVSRDEVISDIDMLLRKQFKSPLFIEDLNLVSDYLSKYNFIDLNNNVDQIDFHFFMESNRLVRESQVSSFINQVLLSNDCLSDRSLRDNTSVKIYLKKFQIDPKFNLGLKHKKNELKDIGYEVISY